MQTLTIDLNLKAMKALEDLELLKLISLHKNKYRSAKQTNRLGKKYKGAMSKQALIDFDQQLNELRQQ